MPYHLNVVPLHPDSWTDDIDRSARAAWGAPPVPVASVQGTLALDLQPLVAPPPLPEVRTRSVLMDVVEVDPRLRRRLEQWSHRYAQAAVEIVGGDRPVSQLLRWTAGEVYADLHRRALLVARAGGHQPGQSRVQPVRPKVVSVHTCFVSETVMEAGIRIRYGERCRAVAARFEQRKERWICTALEFA
jgi:hypothetical protein